MIKEGSLSLSANGTIIRFGHGLESILGYSANDMIGKLFSSLTPAGLEELHKNFFDASVWAGAVTSHRTRLVHKSGNLIDIYLSVYPLRDFSGDLYSFVVTVSVDKDVQMPTILSDEFQRMFRFSNDSVVVTDGEGNIIDVNQSFLETYGYTKAEVLGKNPRILKSGHSTPQFYEKMWKEILDPKKGWWRGELINVAKGGREVPVLLSINAIKDESGHIRNFLGIALDMTREKEFDRINKMYIDYIIHDMRSPLMTIMTNAELLIIQSNEDVSEKMKKKFKAILSCAEKINHMTSDVLDYSRAQSGGLVLRKDRCSFLKLMRDALMPFEHTGKKFYVNGMSYEDSVLEDVEIFVDAEKIERVIYNILSNAFKNAMSEVRLFLDFIDGELRFVVTDDGKGISEQDAAKIFEVFYQTDEGVKTGGAGIGLNIVKCFVEAHGGAVWVEPGHGRGATFGFTLPIGVND